MGLIKKKRCRNCRRLFKPDWRNQKRQRYCEKPDCRKASKKASQEKWLSKPENVGYFSGKENVVRVQEWRGKNPGYSKKDKKSKPLQDPLTMQAIENTKDNSDFTNKPLQDLLRSQSPVIIGLIAQFTDTALQENIASTLLRMQKYGQDILCSQPQTQGDRNDCQRTDFESPYSQGAEKLQLDRPSVGT